LFTPGAVAKRISRGEVLTMDKPPAAPACATLRATARAALLLALVVGRSPLASAQAPAAKPDAAPAYRIGGLVYADYYDVAQSHREALDGQNGFWLRRVYLTYDHTLSKAFSLRLRLEANSKGDFQSTGVNTPYVKDAWLKWSHGAHAVSFGMAPTPNVDFVDAFQGYRSLERNPLDLYKWDSSRDLGLLAQGGLGKEARTGYSFQFGNGSGTGSEVDHSKSVRAQLLHRFASGLVLEAYADWQDRPESRDISTLEAFAGWREKAWRASLQYGHQQRREAGPERSDLSLDFLSAFGAVDVSSRLSLVGRLDRNLDPVPGGEEIDYLPFSEQARSWFALLALDVTLAKSVHLLPNVELSTYDEAQDGTTPRGDVVPRLTLFFSW
jgi:hypothetical protein